MKAWPYVGIAMAVAVGVALAPLVGWIMVAALFLLALLVIGAILRRHLRDSVVIGTMLCGLYVADRIAPLGSGPAKQWAALLAVFAVCSIELLLFQRMERRGINVRP